MGWRIPLALLLMACTTFGEDTNRVKTLLKGAFGGIQEPLQVVITNKTQWAELWEKHSAKKLPKDSPPEIDFSKQSIIFVSAGQKTSGGYAIEIKNVRQAGDKTEVVVATREPRPGGITIQALTAPFHIVAVPKIEGEVKFRSEPEKKGN